MYVNRLQSVTRGLLVTLALLGLVLPVSAMQTCGCCSDNAEQAPHAEACASSEQIHSNGACCDHHAPEVSTVCCLGNSSCQDCGGPDCRCNVKPFDPAPPSTPVSAPELADSTSLGNIPLAQTSPSPSLVSYHHADGVSTPRAGADLRLHSQVSVWLN